MSVGLSVGRSTIFLSQISQLWDLIEIWVFARTSLWYSPTILDDDDDDDDDKEEDDEVEDNDKDDDNNV